MPHISDLIQAARVCCWQALTMLVPELQSLEGRSQHASAGVDVAEHTRRLLVQCPANDILLLAALFHDISKPLCAGPSPKGDGTVFAKDHGEISAKMAKEILQRFEGHEAYLGQVCELVRFHMEPHDGKMPVGFAWPEELVDLAELDSASFGGRSIGKVRERFNKTRIKFNLPERPFPPPQHISTILVEYLKIHNLAQ